MRAALQNFLGGGSPCRAKICGLRSLEDFAVCQAAGAEAVGLNFWPKSKRYLEPAEARRCRSQWPADLARVGVFVNADPAEVAALLSDGVIDAAQLHGEESPEVCERLRDQGHVVFKAIGVRDADSLRVLDAYEVDAVVLDAFCPGTYGGSGKTFNWELALEAKDRLGEVPLVLSGGLHAGNVAEAIQRVRPDAVDVASGVESAPGVKSAEKIEAFMQAVRSASSRNA